MADERLMKQKLQFEITPEALGEVDRLVTTAGFATRAELVRHALRFFQWAVQETREKDAKLLLEKNGRLREIVFPFWAPTAVEHTEEEPEPKVATEAGPAPEKVKAQAAR